MSALHPQAASSRRYALADRVETSAPFSGNVRMLSHDEFLAVVSGMERVVMWRDGRVVDLDAYCAERMQPQDETRYLNWPKVIEAFSIAVAVFAAVYFAGEYLLRAVR